MVGTPDRNDNASILILKALQPQGKRQTNRFMIKQEQGGCHNKVGNTAQMKLYEHPRPSYIVKSVRLLEEMLGEQNSEREMGVYQGKKIN